MSTLSAKKSSNLKTAAPKKTSAKSNSAPRRKAAPIAIVAKTPPQPSRNIAADHSRLGAEFERLTKQARQLATPRFPKGVSM